MAAFLGLFIAFVLLGSSHAAPTAAYAEPCEDTGLFLAGTTFGCDLLLEYSDATSYVGAFNNSGLCKKNDNFHGCCRSCCKMTGVEDAICDQFRTTTTTTTTTARPTPAPVNASGSMPADRSAQVPISVRVNGQDRGTYNTVQDPSNDVPQQGSVRQNDLEVDVHVLMDRKQIPSNRAEDIALEIFLGRRQAPSN